MNNNISEKLNLWLEKADADMKAELLSVRDDENELYERFYKELEFGTGGLRGIMGVGSNRMNIYTVRKATQGLADYLEVDRSGLSAEIGKLKKAGVLDCKGPWFSLKDTMGEEF